MESRVVVIKESDSLLLCKGCPHLFRKSQDEALPVTDCHFEERKSLNGQPLTECVSYAFDFTFCGVTIEGCNDEVNYLVKSVRENKPMSKVFCNPIQAMLRMSKGLMVRLNFVQEGKSEMQRYEARRDRQMLQNMWPFISEILDKEFAKGDELMSNPWCEESDVSDIVPLREGGSIEIPGEAYSGGDQYFCNVCNTELGNLYGRCQGCKSHLELDHAYHVCLGCIEEEAKKVSLRHFEHVRTHGRTVTCNRIHGEAVQLCLDLERKSSECLQCKNDPTKKKQPSCMLCRCTCHQKFEIRRRFIGKEDFQSLQDSFKKLFKDT